MRTRLSYLLNSFLLATALTNEISSFLYLNKFGSISTSFWRYPLKSVRRKALGWISYFMPSSSSVPPNVFSKNETKILYFVVRCNCFCWTARFCSCLKVSFVDSLAHYFATVCRLRSSKKIKQTTKRMLLLRCPCWWPCTFFATLYFLC